MLFQQLFEKSPFEAQLLFRYVGNSGEMRHRWLQMVGTDAYIKILKSFDISEFALATYKQQQELYEVVAEALQAKKATSAKMDIVLADIIWKVLHDGRYRFFSLNDVYTKTFVAMQELLNVQPAVLLTEWKRWLELTDAETTPFRSVVEILWKLYPANAAIPKKESVADRKEIERHFFSFLKEVKLITQSDNDKTASLSLMEWLAETDTADKDKMATYLLNLLKSYLLSGSLPISVTTSLVVIRRISLNCCYVWFTRRIRWPL